jgi:Conserved oligomeric complex COG6
MDMLAWIHQAVASENELLSTLVSSGAQYPSSDGSSVINCCELLDKVRTEHSLVPCRLFLRPELPVHAACSLDWHTSVAHAWLIICANLPCTCLGLVQVLAGVCQPLRLRIEQVLLGSSSMFVTFQIYQLLDFYHATMQQLLQCESQLLSTISELRDTAARGFQGQMKNQTDRLQRGLLQPPSDLTCPPAVVDIVNQVTQIAHAFESDLQHGALVPGSFSCTRQQHVNPELVVASQVWLGATITGCHHTASHALWLALRQAARAAENAERSRATLTTFLNDTVSPLLQSCKAAATEVQHRAESTMDTASQPDQAEAFFLNCLLAIWKPLSEHNVCSDISADLKQQIDGQVCCRRV